MSSMRSTEVRSLVTRASVAASVVVAVAAASAQAHDGDIGLVNDAGKLSTILVSGEPPSQTFGDPERVFGVEMLFSMDDNAVMTDEPHFASNDSTVIGRAINFTMTKSVRKWNNALGVFESTPTTISVGNASLGFPEVTSPPTDMAVAAATIPSFQAHSPVYLWTLDGATDTSGFGVYLVEGVFVNPSASPLESSEPLWLVFNYGEDEAVHDAAVDYAAQVLVPGPSSSLLVVMSAAAALRRRRR